MAKTGELSLAQLEQRGRANLRHGARSAEALAPLSRSIKQALLKRMGLRQADLTWAGREVLDLYSRNRAKLVAIDRWLETHPMIDADGFPAPVLKVYWVSYNAALRTLTELRGVIADLADSDDRFDAALTALAAEGRRNPRRQGAPVR